MADITATVLVPARLYDCTDPKSTRYALGSASACRRATPEGDNNAWITATDAKVAAIVPTSATIAEQTLVPGELIALAKSKPVLAELNGQWTGRTVRQTSANGAWVPDKNPKYAIAAPPEGRFPRVPDVLPEIAPDCVVVRINANALASLADAITEDGDLQLMINPTRSGARYGAIGVLGTIGFGAIAPLSQGETACDFDSERPVQIYNAKVAEYRADAK